MTATPNGHREVSLGRREQDPVLVINPKKWAIWLGLIATFIGVISAAVNYVGTKVAKPSEVVQLQERQRLLIQSVDSFHSRMDTTEVHVQDIKDLIEIIAIDVCLRRADDAFAQSRLRCSTRLRR
jgi:hypothetical protein